MVYIEGENDDYVVNGYISLPEVHRSSRNNMITLVNGRVVRNQELNRTINDSYHSLKPDTRYPITVINIEVDPILVDVNIHPTKMDIKFSKLEDLCLLISKMIKEKLHKKVLIPHIEVEEPKKVYEEIKLDLERIGESNENPYENIVKQEVINEDLIKEEKKLEKFYEEKEEIKRLPELYPVGLVHGTYIICQNEDGMYMIDQHAAKERINYEMYKSKLGNPNIASIPLLVPMTLEFSNSEYIILKENIELLSNMGFSIEEWGINSVIIKEHPAWLLQGYEEDQTRKIIDIILKKSSDFTIEKFNESIATMLSCKMAIKANMNITLEEMENLINDLRKCNNPFNCPHGRPTVIFYSNYDLEKLFKRSGF